MQTILRAPVISRIVSRASPERLRTIALVCALFLTAFSATIVLRLLIWLAYMAIHGSN